MVLRRPPDGARKKCKIDKFFAHTKKIANEMRNWKLLRKMLVQFATLKRSCFFSTSNSVFFSLTLGISFQIELSTRAQFIPVHIIPIWLQSTVGEWKEKIFQLIFVHVSTTKKKSFALVIFFAHKSMLVVAGRPAMCLTVQKKSN